MKKLSKDERIGATALALVALVVCGGAFFVKRMERKSHASPDIVKSIILASKEEAKEDSTNSGKTKADRFKGKKKNSTPKNKSSESKKKDKTKKADKGRKVKKEATPKRDPLSETL